ncbi:sugar transporter domain-containing protein [Sarocladium implicatum]|nr:sugar transporter domain-containing protein [Sarocladium implicatum]
MSFLRRITPKKETLPPNLVSVLPHNAPRWYKQSSLLRLNLILLVPLLSSATIGFDGAMMNGLQTLPQWRNYFNSPNASLLGLMNALYPIGKILAIFPTTWLSDRFGRKLPMWIGFVLLILGATLQACSQNVAMFLVSRFILGAATALIAIPSPILIAELSYPTHRGKLTALYNTFYFLGAVFAAWSTYGTFKLSGSWSWRIPSALQGALPVLQFAFFFFLPESPRWLVAHAKHEEARKVLGIYHGSGDAASPLVAFEMAEIEESIQIERAAASSSSYVDLFNTPANRKRTFLAVTVGWFAQWSGNGVVSYYLVLVLNSVGITKVSQQALINGLLQLFNWFAAVFGGALMVDLVGRRTLFLVSAGGMCLSYIAWTVLTSVFVDTLNQTVGNVVVAFIFIYFFFYDIAFTPLMPAYPIEIFPYTLRGRGVTAAYCSTYVGLILGQFVNPIAMESIGWRYYIVFCCLLAVLFVTVWNFFPETKGRTLEEIAEIFDGKPHHSTEESILEQVVDNDKMSSQHSETVR